MRRHLSASPGLRESPPWWTQRESLFERCRLATVIEPTLKELRRGLDQPPRPIETWNGEFLLLEATALGTERLCV